MKIAFYRMTRTRSAQRIAPEAVEQLLTLPDTALLDCIDGSLLDEYLIAIGDNLLIAYEQYLNEWSSCYRITYGNPDKIGALWEQRQQEAEEAAAEAEARYHAFTVRHDNDNDNINA